MFCDFAAGLFVMATDELGQRAVLGCSYALAIAIIDKGRDDCAVLPDLDQSVFGIISQTECVRTDHARDLIAVGIIGVGVAACTGGRVFVCAVSIGECRPCLGFQVVGCGVIVIGFGRAAQGPAGKVVERLSLPTENTSMPFTTMVYKTFARREIFILYFFSHSRICIAIAKCLV
jgi:hypothetical protein